MQWRAETYIWAPIILDSHHKLWRRGRLPLFPGLPGVDEDDEEDVVEDDGDDVGKEGDEEEDDSHHKL